MVIHYHHINSINLLELPPCGIEDGVGTRSRPLTPNFVLL